MCICQKKVASTRHPFQPFNHFNFYILHLSSAIIITSLRYPAFRCVFAQKKVASTRHPFQPVNHFNFYILHSLFYILHLSFSTIIISLRYPAVSKFLMAVRRLIPFPITGLKISPSDFILSIAL